jgi:CRISPR-associated protein Csc3
MRMTTREELEKLLELYLEKVLPAMLRRQYHLRLVKGGPDYPHLSEQSHLTHIINGVMGLCRLMLFLIATGFNTSIDILKKAFALYTIHEVHKDKDVEKIGSSEFSIPLERLQEEYKALGLREFAGDLDPHLMRLANVHKRSNKQGDLLLSEDPDAAKIWLLVRIADTIASVRTPEEAASSLIQYLRDLSPQFVEKYTLHYHQIKDVRGVLTNALHQAIASKLERTLGFFPLLFFASGMLYIGPRKVEGATDELISQVTEQIIALLTQGGSADDIRDGLRSEKYDFESYVFTFASPEDLLEVVYQDTLAVKPEHKFAQKEVKKLAEGRKGPSAGSLQTIEGRLGIRITDSEERRAFNERWFMARRYLLYIDGLLRDLAQLNEPKGRLDWFLHTFAVPEVYASCLREDAAIWATGGIGKYVLIVAYHFLAGSDFVDRGADELPPEEVLKRLHNKVLSAIKQLNLSAGRQAIAAEMGIQQELTDYLGEILLLSFAPRSTLGDDGLKDYTAKKRKGHTKPFCSLCNRASRFAAKISTGVLEDLGRVFSNRVLPAQEAPNENRYWCPICHLEFILRKRAGMGLPPGADHQNSRRIYIYVMPTYSFTPLHLRLFEPLLRPFHQVTNLPVRDYGRDWGLPHHWLEQRTLDPEWLSELQDVLEREAEKIAQRGGQKFVGERLSLGRIQGQPHYYLITWQKAARGQEKEGAGENNRIATRTEAWAKAIFAAAIIHGLTGCKVYVTERPYLPVTDPDDLKPTITLDGPPPALRAILNGQRDAISLYGRERGARSGLERVLDLSAALWVVTAGLTPGKDKHVSARLERLNTDPLAGAFFYKEYGREHDGASPQSPFDVACHVLLQTQGGELMNLVEQIARKSLEIALPISAPGRGKARRYELIFREAVSAMRKAQQSIPELRSAALGARRPSDQAVAELKTLTAGALLKGLQRRQESKRGDIFVRDRGGELGRLVQEFVDIVVDELYLQRAKGNLAVFLQLENQVANGIYYYTDRHIGELWNEHKQQKAKANLPSGVEQ